MLPYLQETLALFGVFGGGFMTIVFLVGTAQYADEKEGNSSLLAWVCFGLSGVSGFIACYSFVASMALGNPCAPM